jgi:hypothetical protein
MQQKKEKVRRRRRDMKPVTSIWLTSLRTSALEGLGLLLATFTESTALPFPLSAPFSACRTPRHYHRITCSEHLYISSNGWEAIRHKPLQISELTRSKTV